MVDKHSHVCQVDHHHVLLLGLKLFRKLGGSLVVLCKIHAAIYTIAGNAAHQKKEDAEAAQPLPMLVGRFTKCLNPCQRI